MFFYKLFLTYKLFNEKSMKKYAPGPPEKKRPPDKNLASGVRAGTNFLSGDQFVFSGGAGPIFYGSYKKTCFGKGTGNA